MEMKKQQEIIERLLNKVKQLEYGKLVIELKVHEGKIKHGEIVEKKEVLG